VVVLCQLHRPEADGTEAGVPGYTSDNLPSCKIAFARNGSPFGRGYVRYDWLTAETLRPRLSPVLITYLRPPPPCSQIVLLHRQTMIIMEHPEGGGDDPSQKRKRRPKSYQGCTQCRLARRKCGEGIDHVLFCLGRILRVDKGQY